MTQASFSCLVNVVPPPQRKTLTLKPLPRDGTLYNQASRMWSSFSCAFKSRRKALALQRQPPHWQPIQANKTHTHTHTHITPLKMVFPLATPTWGRDPAKSAGWAGPHFYGSLLIQLPAVCNKQLLINLIQFRIATCTPQVSWRVRALLDIPTWHSSQEGFLSYPKLNVESSWALGTFDG